MTPLPSLSRADLRVVSEPAPRASHPLSFNQSSYLTLEWLAHLRSKPRRPVPMVLGVSLEGVPDAGAIEDALNEVIRRHEVLRTGFPDPRRLSPREEAALTAGLKRGIADTGVWSPQVRPAAPLRLLVVPAAAAEPFAIPEATQARIQDEIDRPFDYTAPPLMRAALYALDATHRILIVTLDHLVADAWSAGVLRAELRQLYDRRVTGRPFDEVPPLTLQYGDFARRQRDEFADLPEALVSYCKARWAAYGHAQVGPADLPPGRRLPAERGGIPGYDSLPIEPALAQALRAMAKRLRVTTYMLGLAAIAVLFHAYTRRTELAWWGYCSNRTSIELERLIGWIAHGRMFGITLAPGEPVSELVARVRARAYEMYDHERVPVQVFWRILAGHGLAAPGAFGEEYLSFDAVVAPVSRRIVLADGTVMRAVPRTLLKNGNWPSLGVWSIEDGPDWRLDCRYSSTRCDASAIASFLDDLAGVLGAMVRTPGAAVSELASRVTGR